MEYIKIIFMVLYLIMMVWGLKVIEYEPNGMNKQTSFLAGWFVSGVLTLLIAEV